MSRIICFDIETTGLKKETTQVYLIGCAYFRNDAWHLRQYFADKRGEEDAERAGGCLLSRSRAGSPESDAGGRRKGHAGLCRTLTGPERKSERRSEQK